MSVTEEDRRIVETAMRLAAQWGWRTVTMADVTRESGVPLVQVYRRVPSKAAVLCKLVAIADEAVLDQGVADAAAGESGRDRLFDVLMRRFDALRPYRDGLRSVYRDLRYRPFAGGLLGLSVARSMGWMRSAAGLEGKGPPACLADAGLAFVYLSAFRVWLEDDTADMARTMAALDRGLRRGEEWAHSCMRRNKPRGTAETAPETPAPQPG